MAIEDSHREDLLRDARQFTRRVGLVGAHSVDARQIAELFVGLRPGGAWSVYYDQDPVLQFNDVGELRRLFVDGHKYTCERGRVVRLDRANERQAGRKLELVRVTLDEASQEQLLEKCAVTTERYLRAWMEGHLQIEGCVPPDDHSLIPEAQQLLRNLVETGGRAWKIATTPNAQAG